MNYYNIVIANFKILIDSNFINIIDPHLDLEVETGWDSRFSVFLGSKSKFTG